MSGLVVAEVGVSVLVQDLGRPGWAHVGVPRSGALDGTALALANRLVGNPPGAAGLEVLIGGCAFIAGRSLRVAIAGSRQHLVVDDVARPWGEAVSVRQGQRFGVEPAAGALRGWLAVDGGIAVAPVLGSRASDTLTGLGPAPLSAGDVVPLGMPTPPAPAGSAVPPRRIDGPCRLTVALGPRAGLLTDASIRRLLSLTYAVAPDSNRVGVRLTSPDADRLERHTRGELPSEGIVTGAVQVPPSGDPLIFLNDHPVTGGYPVVAVVDAVDLALCAQLAPGDLITFGV